MILAIDIGNTTIGIGVFSDDTLILYEKISSGESCSTMDYIKKLNIIFENYGLSMEQLKGSILSSVVPRITNIFKSALEMWTCKKVLLLSHETNLDFTLCVDAPEKVGCDRLADAAGAVHNYPVPLITIDMGTATTINVIDEKLRFRGGVIMPGVGTAHQALLGKAAQLFDSDTAKPSHLIGKNTAECISSGMVYGNACAIDGLIQRINQELGQTCTMIATGGNSERIIPYCQSDIIIDRYLLMKGLKHLFDTNK